MERSVRLARIQALMSRATGVTLAQLMADLEVSRATIHRDLELMRSQMNTPIVWNRDTGTYHIDPEQGFGVPSRMLPGIWLKPAQAYAFLTLNNMVEKIAPQLLGPFVWPMRDMLKRMLFETDYPMHRLDKKVAIEMPGVPELSDLTFTTLIDGLLREQPLRITLKTTEGAPPPIISGTPTQLRIRHDGWQLQLETAPAQEQQVDLRDVLDVALVQPARRQPSAPST